MTFLLPKELYLRTVAPKLQQFIKVTEEAEVNKRAAFEGFNSKKMNWSLHPDFGSGTEGLSIPDDLSSLTQKEKMEKMEDPSPAETH